MAALRMLWRTLALLLGLALLAVGSLTLGMAYAPDEPSVKAGQALFARLAEATGPGTLSPRSAQELTQALSGQVPRFAIPSVGLLLLAFAVFPRASRGDPDQAGAGERRQDEPPPMDRSTRRRAEKQIKALIKQGETVEAAELCYTSNLLDQAIELFVQAGEFVRAAELQHDLNHFREAAKLYEKGGRYEPAAAIYSEQEDFGRAADCFLKAGRKSIAAEMFEKAGQHARAADTYAECGFHRHAAQAFIRCQRWAKAAALLEEVIREEGGRIGGGRDPKREKELRTLILHAGKLWEQAGELERAQSVLERGGCLGPAAELALRLQQFSKASELFQRAGDPRRAAEALQQLGEDKAAAQILGEYHRDRGEDQEAARALEKAGDLSSAGDLYRKLQDWERAGVCYERNHDAVQAAEMFRLAGDVVRAARSYEDAKHFAEAAECYAEVCDARREAELLAKAQEYLRAGAVYHRDGDDDEAIKVLQKVGADHPDLAQASALLGQIFAARGMYSLSIKKLRQALSRTELSRENIAAFYTLATVYDANGELHEALDLYEKILACDYHYEDVEDRLDAAREKFKIKLASEGGSAAPSGPGGAPTPTSTARYQIVEELGRGGMGIVYKAQDIVLDRTVAYKVLPDALKESPQALKNFLREAKSAAQLNHPNIVTVYDAGEQGGRYYIAMEFVDGTTLKEILGRRGVIPSGGVLHVLRQMCEALAYAHEKKIVHRDIKTANTMWTRDKQAKIMDFGLAKVIEEVRNHTTLVSGTPYYMSPEQTLGRNVDHRADIYSLGVTIFELATGQLPFREGNIPYHHVHTPPPDPRSVNSRLPELLAGIILRCLQKDPEARYGSTREILAELKSSRAKRD